MTAPPFLRKLLSDPPPRYAFEISQAGLAAARTGTPPQTSFEPLDPDVISVSPVHDNVLRMEALTARVQALAPARDKKRQRAALILPDYCVRVSVLDFDSFPSDAGQQLSLVRFRVKKSLPFDLDSARVSYFAQLNGKSPKGVDVVTAVTPLEILARYELPFRSAGFHTGVVTTSTLAALEMIRGKGVYVFAKVSGRVLTLAVIAGGVLKLLRSIELAEAGSVPEIVSHLYPTFAYVEDQLASAPEKLIVCGFPQFVDELRDELAGEADLEIEPLRSRYGAPDQSNAGLLGYLEAFEEAA
jgi:type IV pilus assembly protein PilM